MDDTDTGRVPVCTQQTHRLATKAKKYLDVHRISSHMCPPDVSKWKKEGRKTGGVLSSRFYSVKVVCDPALASSTFSSDSFTDSLRRTSELWPYWCPITPCLAWLTAHRQTSYLANVNRANAAVKLLWGKPTADDHLWPPLLVIFLRFCRWLSILKHVWSNLQ